MSDSVLYFDLSLLWLNLCSWQHNIWTLYTMTLRRFYSRLSTPKNRLYIAILILLSTIYFLARKRTPGRTSMYIEMMKFKNVAAIEKRACVHPRLELDNAEILNLFGEEIKVKCEAEKNWVYVDNGTFMISTEAEAIHGDIECAYTSLLRGKDDFTWSYDKVVSGFKSGTRIPTDFFNVTCYAADKTKYENVHEAISYQPDLHKNDATKKLRPKSIGTNVLIIGLDSVSRMMWLRKMPLLNKLLEEEFGAVILEGMNVMGDGTPAATFPMLTGKTEEELPEARRKIDGAVTLDSFPFIWKEFKNIGYITQMAEDYSDVAMYTYRLRGFDTQPTDHFSRPYYLVTEEAYMSDPKPHCTGSEPNSILDLKWINDTYTMYPNKLKFMFHFLAEFTHSRGRVLFNHIDVEMSSFLRRFKAEGHLDNTILVVMSDHGCRFSELRETAQGKQEERLPYVSVTFPEWFKIKYPIAYANVVKNSKGLTTANDIHEMLLDIVEFRTDKIGDINKRGISLFREIPHDRTCKNAGIDDHWCACLNWNTVALTDTMITRIANEADRFFNAILEPAFEYCEKLSLKEITKAYRLIPNDDVLRFKGAADADGRVADFTDKTQARMITYQLYLTTAPNDGHFELSVLYDTLDDKISFNSHFVSRTNKYGEDPRCIMETFTQLRMFCKCKPKYAGNGL